MGPLTEQIPSAVELKRIREDLGLTQAELAQALGMKKNAERNIRQWENDDGFKPTGLAWAALRFLVGLETMYRHLLGADREMVRQLLPEVMR